MHTVDHVRLATSGEVASSSREPLPPQAPVWIESVNMLASGSNTFDIALEAGVVARVVLQIQLGVGGIATVFVNGQAFAWSLYLTTTTHRDRDWISTFIRILMAAGSIRDQATSPNPFSVLFTITDRPIVASVCLGDERRSEQVRQLELAIAKRLIPAAVPQVFYNQPPEREQNLIERILFNEKVAGWFRSSWKEKLRSKPGIAIIVLLVLFIAHDVVSGSASIEEFVPGRTLFGSGHLDAWVTLEFDREPLFGDPRDVRVVFRSSIFSSPDVCNWDYIAKHDVVPQGFMVGFEMNEETKPQEPPPLDQPIKVRCRLNPDLKEQTKALGGVDLTATLYWGRWKQDSYKRVVD